MLFNFLLFQCEIWFLHDAHSLLKSCLILIVAQKAWYIIRAFGFQSISYMATFDYLEPLHTHRTHCCSVCVYLLNKLVKYTLIVLIYLCVFLYNIADLKALKVSFLLIILKMKLSQIPIFSSLVVSLLLRYKYCQNYNNIFKYALVSTYDRTILIPFNFGQ